MTSRSHWKLLGAAVVALAVVTAFGAMRAPAATYTWQGGDFDEPTSWTVADNWFEAGGPPSLGDTAVFTTNPFEFSVDLGTAMQAVDALEFTGLGFGEDYTIANGTLGLGFPGANAALTQDATVDADTVTTISAGVVENTMVPGLELSVEAGTLRLTGQLGASTEKLTAIVPAGGTSVASGATLAITNATTEAATKNYVDGTIAVAGRLEGVGNALDAATVELQDGGALHMTGTVETLVPGLLRKRYEGGVAGGSGWDPWDTLAAQTPVEVVADTNGINDGSDGDAGTVPFLDPPSDLGNYAMTWEGFIYLEAGQDGVFQLRSRADDHHRVWVNDLAEGNPVLSHSGANNTQNTTYDFSGMAEMYIPFRAGFTEGGGGDYMWFAWDGGTGTITDDTIADGPGDPLAGNQFWHLDEVTRPAATDTNLALVAGATGTLEPTGDVALGSLTFNDGSTLNVAPTGNVADALSFTDTTMASGTDPVSGTLNTPMDVPAGPLTLGDLDGVSNSDSTVNQLTKDGAGKVTFTDVKSADDWNATLEVTVNAGELAMTGQVGNPIPAEEDIITFQNSNVNAGGTLSVTNYKDGDARNKVAGSVNVNPGGTLVFGGKSGASSLGSADVVLDGGKVVVEGLGGAVFQEIAIDNDTPSDNEGSYTFDGTTHRVEGSGDDIWNNADDFYYVYQEVPEGAAIDVSAHVLGFDGGTNGWRKAFLMIRDDLTAPSAFNGIMQSANDNVGGQWRDSAGAGAASGYHGGDPEPTWIRIVREAGADTASYYFKQNEADPWQLEGTHAVSMTDVDYIGMGVTSHNEGELTTGLYQNVEGFIYDMQLADLGNDVTISGTSEIETLGPVLLGDATVADATALTVTSPADGLVAFATSTFGDGASAAGATLNPTTGDLYLGEVNDQGQALTLTKTGAGALVFDQTDVANTTANTTVDLQEGTVGAGGTAGGVNPLGGAVVQMTGADTAVVLTSKGGDYALDNAFDFDASGRLEAHTFGFSGVAENATITLDNPTAGGFDIATGETLTVSTADGYTLNLDNEVSGGGTLLVESGKVTVANDGVLDGGTPLEIGPFGFVHFIVPPAVQPPIGVGGGGAIGGDLGGVDMGNVDFGPGGIVVQDPATGNHPTFAQQGACDLYLGVTDVAGTYDGIGCNEGGGDISGDGPAYEGTYRGVALDPMFATGDFTGTIGEAEQDPPTYHSSGYEVLIRDDWTFDGATFDAEAGHPVTVIGEPGKLATFTTAINGTADTFIREGIAPVDGGSAGDMSSDILAFAGADVLAGDRIMTLKNGVATFATGGNNGVAADATLEIDQNATLFLTSAPANGTLLIKEGGYLRFSDQAQLAGGATFEYEDVTPDANPWVINDQDIFDWVAEGFPTDKAVNIVASAGRFDLGLFVGQNSVITLPYSESRDLRQHGASDPWSIQIHDDLKDGSADTVRMAVAEGQTMQVHSNTDLSNDLGDADSRATLVVGYGPGETLPWLPSGGGSLNYQQVPMTGSTYFRLGEGEDGHLLGGLDVRSGEARFGDNDPNNGQQAVLVDINGPVTVREGASLVLRATQNTDYTPQLEAGTWGTTQTWEKDSYVEWMVKNDTGDVRELTQAVIVGGGAADASEATHFNLDHYEQQGGSDQGPDEGYLLTDVTMQDGAYLELEQHNFSDKGARRLHLKLEGTATAAGNDFSISGEAAVPGTPVTLLVGDAAHPDPTFTLGITGPLSEDVTLLDNQAENTDHWLYDLYYGKYANGVDEDGDGDPLREEWGAGSTLEIGGQHIINVRVDEDGDGANPLNTNVFAGTVRVMNNVEPGTLPQWDEVEKNLGAVWDARIRSDRDANRGRPRQLVEFKDLVLADGALVTTGDDDANSISDITLEGPTGYYWNNAGRDHFVRDVTGTPGSVLVLYPDNDLDMLGTITDTDLMAVGDDDIWLQPGFDLGGNTFTYQLSDQFNVMTDPGAGTINIGPNMQGENNFDGDHNGLEIFHGANNDDTIGETGWGDDLVITHAGQVRINMRSDKALTAGDQNINVLNAEIRVADNSEGWDLDLYADSDVNAPPGLSVNHFANVHILPDDPELNDAMPELRFRQFDGSHNRVSLVLENDVQLRAGPGGGGQLYYIGDLTDAVPDDGTEHTVYAVTNGAGEDAPLDGTIGDEVVLQLDANGGGQFRITEPLNETAFGSLDLNGRTVQVARSTNGGGRFGALVVMDDAPAGIGTGTILVDGGLHGDNTRLAFDADHDGSGNEVNWGEDVDIIIQNTTDNDAEVEGWVDTGNVGPVQTIAQKVQIVDANTDWGAHDARVDAEHRSDDGFSPGRVEFENLEFHLDARAELRASGNGNMPRLLVNPTINGRAGLVNNSSESRIFVGDVDYADGVVPAGDHDMRLESMGGQQTRFVGNVDANVVNWNWASLEDGFVVTDSATGDTDGHFDVDGLTFLRTDIEADAITVFDGGDNVLYIDTLGATKFDPADLDLANGARLGLTVDRDLADDAWDTVDDRQARIYIGKNAYAGTLTLNDNDTEIGSDLRDNASMTAPLAGAATQVTFEGGDNMLTLEAGVIDEAGLGGGSPVSVNYANNVRIAGAQSHTGDAMVSADRTYMLDTGAFGSGAVISAGGTLDLQVDLANPLVLAGGGIYATGTPRAVTGALTDAGNADPGTVTLGADDTLTFTQDLQVKGPRTVDVTDGTAVFAGNLTSDAGTWTVTKAGTGSLQLDGDASGVNLQLGTSPGGTTLVGASGTPPAAVTIGHDSAYGVEQVDHDYAEVDMAASTGAIALGADTNVNLTMQTEMKLGAANDSRYTGSLSPNAGTYELGGGDGTLTVAAGSMTGANDLNIGPRAPVVTDTTGLTGTYIDLSDGGPEPQTTDDIDFAQTPILTRIDPVVDWTGWEAPGSGDDADNWPQGDNLAIIWEGGIEITPAEAGQEIQFGVNSDDGVELLIDGQLASNPGRNKPQGMTGNWNEVAGAPMTLSEGYHSLQLKYWEWAGGEGARLLWDVGLTGTGTLIPADNLLSGTFDELPYDGMVVLEGADATDSVTGVIDINMAAGIKAAGTGDDPFSAIDDATEINIGPDGSLDIGDADLTTATATTALGKLTLAGGFTRNGATITLNDMLDMDTGDWPLGVFRIGGGGGEGAVTTLQAGTALASGEILNKVGSNTLHLVAGDVNWIDHHVIDGGKVIADDQNALGQSLRVEINNDAELEMGAENLALQTRFVLNDQAVLDLQGHTYVAAASNTDPAVDETALTLGAGADALLTGGVGTVLDLAQNSDPADKIAAGSGSLTLDNDTTLITAVGGSANFNLRNDATLRYTDAAGASSAGIGSMQPGALVTVDDGVSGTINGGAAITFDVDPDAGPAGWSSDTNTYEINVGTDSTLTFDSNAWPGDSTFHSASYTDETGMVREPVAYVEKTGAGTMAIEDANYDDGMNQPNKIYWIVSEGTLNAGGDTTWGRGLNATAGGWVGNDSRTLPISRNHLEGVEIGENATLIWEGLQGALPAADWYPGLLPEDGSEGDGLLADELIMNHNATLQGEGLVLGFYHEYQKPATDSTDLMIDAYPLYPTVVTNSPTTVNLGGQIELRSGIKLTDTGPLTVNVNGDVHFGNTDLIDRVNADGGSLGTDVIDTLNVQGGSANIYRSQTAMSATNVDAGAALNIDPDGAAGDPVTYAGTVNNDGTVSVQSGEVTMEGNLLNNGTATFSGDTVNINGATVTNDGVMKVTAGTTNVQNQITSSAAPGELFTSGLVAGKTAGNNRFNDLPTNPDALVVLPDLQDMNWSGNGAGPDTFANGDEIPTVPGTELDGNLWNNNHTWVYEGEFFHQGGTANFGENFDDGVLLVIDGQTLLDDGGWNTQTAGTFDLAPGWYDFHAAFAQGGGGAGPVQGFPYGLGYDPAGGTSWEQIPSSSFRTPGDALGILSVSGGAVANVNGGFTGFNAVEIHGTLNVGASSDTRAAYNNGTLNVQDGVTLNVTGEPGLIDGNLSNSGNVSVGTGSLVNVAGAVSNDGNITVGDGSTVASNGLTMTTNGTIDLTGGNVIVGYEAGSSPFDQVEAWVVSGYNGGTWDGDGIASSLAATDGKPTALAVADNTDPLLGIADLEGELLDADGSDVLVKFTWFGDANFDGVIDAADYALIDQSWNGGNQSPAGGGDWRWAAGDFNYDGIVDAADYALIDQVWNNFQGQTLGEKPALLGTGGGTPTPEPATLALLALGAGAMLARRRRNR